jgi:acyl-coenzyme A synthetase/AMP-(fatty) acid ligase
MLINLSNHPSAKWSEKQKQAAIIEFGWIHDIAFPQIDPKAITEEIEKLADKYVLECEHEFYLANIPESQQAHNEAVHIVGEMTFCYAIIRKLQQHNIRCVASTTERNVVEESDGKKNSDF